MESTRAAPSYSAAASYGRESARLSALARVAGAVGGEGGLSGVIQAIAEGVESAFGFGAAINLFDEDRDSYVVRAVAGGGGEDLLGSSSSRSAFEELMPAEDEVVPDVYFISHDARRDLSGFSAMVQPEFPWAGPGYWHPGDMCLVRMRTSQGKALGILSVDSPSSQPLPDRDMFEVLRLFAMVGANAIENVILMREVKSLEMEREMKELRQELEDEVALSHSLLDIGTRLGGATAGASEDIFQLVSERLNAVIPVRALTIYAVDYAARIAHPIWHSLDDPDTEAILAFDVPFGVGVTGGVAVEGRTLISNAGRPRGEKVDIPDTDVEIDEHLLVVPVMVEERTRAVLTMRRPEREPRFTEHDANRAELFAQHVASVLLLNELAASRRLLAAQVEQLQDLNRLKDEFVANVSHELRTPLTSILGNVMTVSGLGDTLPAEERRELLTAAERQARRLAELLENLLSESRLAGDTPALVPVRVEVETFLQEVAEILRHRAADRSIQSRAAPGLSLVTDRTLLYRVLFNLGDNAIKYSDGPVWLQAEPDQGGVRLDVIDHGVGIAPNEISTIFEQFRQLDGSSQRRVGGIGLGLHLCARATEALGGRISVRSEVGKGSTFSVWLPAGEASEEVSSGDVGPAG